MNICLRNHNIAVLTTLRDWLHNLCILLRTDGPSLVWWETGSDESRRYLVGNVKPSPCPPCQKKIGIILRTKCSTMKNKTCTVSHFGLPWRKISGGNPGPHVSGINPLYFPLACVQTMLTGVRGSLRTGHFSQPAIFYHNSSSNVKMPLNSNCLHMR